MGFPLGVGAWDQKPRVIGLTRSMTISSAVWIDTIHQRDGRTEPTDGRTPGESKDRAYLRIRAVKKSSL